ncbi:outer membrane protein assembly factor BamA [Solimicrobium silvestre]|uniref:Outer membrane protein assembly factor BamA n=1 Tax=Solimicrobium silvestre TaxID=2099400 RepID=A0A2S9GWQ9_9BURK|nr:outer membrane protein assembly factor BamA [Solimicrobium silvestre]PRC92154.1 Outer membrane protein assembly complex, YaeT protein [Solimicrobium silvestre]
MKLHSAYFPLPNFPRRLVAIAAFALSSGSALAIQPFVVKDIRVEGAQRTEAGTIFSYLPVRVGDTFTDEKSIAAIKSLYATGFFKDVQIEAQGNVLVIVLEERPSVGLVEFTGMKEFEKDVLIKALKEIGVGEGRIFDKASVDRAEQELKRQYLSRGLYGVQVTTTVTPIERNRVNINFVVDEGEVARIKKISFIGNKAFSDKELQDNIALRTPGWFTWYSKADQYSKQKLSGDLESLKSFYQNRGYIEMNVDSTQISITPDKKDIYITINLTEGEQYTVTDIRLEGETFGRDAEFKSLLTLKSGETYSAAKLTESTKKITDRMGNFGYAFANVNANPDVDREKKEVAFTIFLDPGKRVYVRKIGFAGNTTTRDEVIRREFRQFEGSWYDGQKIKLSRDRVDRLGYFKEVTIETPEVAGSTDQIDVNLNVVENPTGNFTLGAGYSQAEHFTISGGLSKSNAFGSGDTIGISVNTSQINRTVALSRYEPYLTDDGISRSEEVYLRTNTAPIGSFGGYNVRTIGSDVKFGVPFTELDTIYFGLGVENTKVETKTGSPYRYQKYVTDYGNGQIFYVPENPITGAPSYIDEVPGVAKTFAFPMTMAWQRDSRDSALTPSIGSYQRANLEVALLGDMKYMRTVYQRQYFQPFFSNFATLALNGEIDYGRGFNGNPFPIFKNWYAGGIGSVRGFETSSLGSKDPVTGDSTGGASRLILNAELQFPFPGSANDRSLRWFVFSDAGNVYDEGAAFRGGVKASYGIGISWLSPMGPLKLSLAHAINATDLDRKKPFDFQIGGGF